MIRVIQYIEEVGAEFNQLRLGQGEALSQRYIHIALTWPAEDVATNIAYVSGGSGARVNHCSTIMSAWNRLPRLHQRLHELRKPNPR